MNIKKLSLFSALLLFTALVCAPGVKAKYVMTSEAMVFGLETKTSVKVTFDCAEIGVELPRDSETDAWEYVGSDQQIAQTKIILGEEYYGHAMYGEDKNAIPNPVRANGIFIGWKGKDGQDVIVTADNHAIFTGEYAHLRPVFEMINLKLQDSRGHIPEPGTFDYWEGSGSEATVNFSVEDPISRNMLPDLKGMDEEKEFLGWFYEQNGESIQIIPGKTILPLKQDYVVTAVWGDRPAAQSLNISNSVY